MRAMVLTGIRQMEMRQVPDPKIESPTGVLIKMEAVGICGSDVHYYTTGRIGSQVVVYPFAVGHECAGRVEAVGSGVTQVKPGDRIAVEPSIPCGQCDQCRAGRIHTCRKVRFLGCPGQIDGCLSDYIVMPEENCFHIKDSTSMEAAAFVEPLSIGVYGAKMGRIQAGNKIAILGMGPIGHSVMAAARAGGVSDIYCTDKLAPRVDLARRMGATWAGQEPSGNVVKTILEHEPGGMDVVFECCGQQAALDQAIELLRPGGTLALIGIPETDRISFTIDVMRRKEICVQNIRRQVHCQHEALAMVETGGLNVEPLITHRFPFEQTKDGFDLVADYKDGILKAMIVF